MDDFEEMYKDRDDKYVCLMDMALMAMKRLKKDGILDNMEESDEINACSIVVPVEIDGKEEEWLISFKNETHNRSNRDRTIWWSGNMSWRSDP